MESSSVLGTAQVKTPGKIIISGEHSVVYHKPALVMAINLYTQTRCNVSVLPASPETDVAHSVF